MNYKVLYRKYRPDAFDNLIGQDHVVSILKNSIKEQKIAHAYLFSGPRGTGKTSTARILAKSINCLNNKNGFACGECDNCLSFATNPDIIEIDAASNNGVDEIRELINNVKIMPTSLKYKVYIIDEVHMLSQSAFNALLLTLEEPPEHVVFILATTNLESVPITIISRCQKFNFKKINEEEIVKRLKFVCDNENIKYDEAGLNEIAELADGGLRDALSMLDQLSKNDEEITSELVAKEIGSISNKKIDELIKKIDQNDVSGIVDIFKEFQEMNLNYKVVIKKIIVALSDVGVSILNGKSTWNFNYDTCKNIILDLNNIMNKISINVDAYLLIKMIFLGYIKLDNKVSDGACEVSAKKMIENKEKNIVDNQKTEKINLKESLKVSRKNDDIKNNFVNIRINNCFVNANKKYLIDLKEKWNDFIINVRDSAIKGLISDTEVVTASDTYAIIVTLIRHKDVEINQKLPQIEELFASFIPNYKFIFIDEEKWKKEKQKYIENLQKKYEYTYIAEEDTVSEKNSDDISSLAGVFDIDKIEVE